MKKQGFIRSFAAILAILTVFVSLPDVNLQVATVDGMWTTYTNAAQYDEDFSGNPKSIPGYEYTDDGFHMTAADWEMSNSAPFATLQTKEPIHLKDGIYMLVRVDEFTYANDKWFNLHIWDRPMIEPGSRNYGEGVQTLIRPTNGTEENPIGKISTVAWYYGPFDGGGSATMPTDAVNADDNGKPLMALTVTWDGTTYAADINGAAAPEKVITYMNEKWGTNDETYIGFSAQNANLGGTVEATVLKFGTDKDTAATPAGDDSKEPENFDNSVEPTYAYDANGLYYALNSGETAYTLQSIGNCTATDIVIASSLNGLPVTNIRDGVFLQNTKITSVTIPNSVTIIGRHAFSGCTSLTSVSIPEGVTKIGAYALGANGLTSVVIPTTVTEIGDQAFRNTSLKSIVDTGTSNVVLGPQK